MEDHVQLESSKLLSHAHGSGEFRFSNLLASVVCRYSLAKWFRPNISRHGSE